MVTEITEVSSPRRKNWCMEKAHGMRNGLGKINRIESTRLAADIEIGTGLKRDAQLIVVADGNTGIWFDCSSPPASFAVARHRFFMLVMTVITLFPLDSSTIMVINPIWQF